MATAILVDAAFFLRRVPVVWPNLDKTSPSEVAKKLYSNALSHLHQPIAGETVRCDLYRIFVYDCPPLEKKAQYPISKKPIDFSKTEMAIFRRNFHKELLKLRKVALRLGRLSVNSSWKIHPDAVKTLVSGKRQVSELTDHDFQYDIKQKGVDIRIGIDICSLTLKHQVNQIVLVSGDADFVPAGKLARREGVDFVLDPMWDNIGADLTEHIDGMRSTCPRPNHVGADVADMIAKGASPTPEGSV